MIDAFAQYPLRNTVITLTVFDFKAFNAPHDIKFSNRLVSVEEDFLVSVMDLRVNDGCFCYIFNFFLLSGLQRPTQYCPLALPCH